MKNMKKFSGLIALICVLLAVMLFATACGNAQGGDKATTENKATNTPTEAPTTETPTTETPTTGGSTDDPVTPPDDGKVTYKVTVLGDDGTKLEGVSVQMCDDAGCRLPVNTNAEGVVEFRYAPSNYHVTLLSAPAGYVVDTTAQYFFTNNELKILLKKAPDTVTYKVEVVDHEGFVLEGVTVVLSDATASQPGVKTNADGVAVFTLPEGTYGIELFDIPEGFGKEPGYFFPEGKTEVKISLPALPAYTLTAQDLFGQMVANVEVNVYRKDAGNLVATKTTGADGKVTFYLAEGEYVVTASNPVGYTLSSTGLEFNSENKTLVAYYLDGVTNEKAYQIVVVDGFGQTLAGVKVNIYKSSDDSLVREELTSDWGTIDVMLPLSDYYAVIEIPDGYSVAENKFLFNEDRVAEIFLDGGIAPTFDYSIFVQDSNTGAPIPGITVTLMYAMTGMPIGTAVSDADGIVVFAGLESGMYMGSVMSSDLPDGYSVVYDAYFYGSTETSLFLERPATGEKDSPFAIVDGENFITLGANQTLYYYISYAGGKIVTTDNANVVISIDGVDYTAVDGVLTIVFESSDEAPKLLAISTVDGAAAEFVLTFKGVAGSVDNPIILETLGDYTAIVEEEGDGIFYRWTATQSGVLVFKTNNALNDCYLVNSSKYWYGSSSQGGFVIYMTVAEGDVVDLCVDTLYDTTNWVKPGAEILFNLSMSTASESEPLELFPGTINTNIPAGEKYFYTIDNPEGLKLVIQSGFGENPVLVFNGVEYNVDPMTGIIKIVFEGSDPVSFSIEAVNTDLIDTVVSVSNANGSGTMEDPFVLNTLDTITVSVPENQELIYAWTATANGVLTLNMTNVLNNVGLLNATTWDSVDYTEGALTTSIEVKAGDVIKIGVSTVLDTETWNTPAADIEISFTFNR